MAARCALVQGGAGTLDGLTRDVDIDLVVGEHEADALVLTDTCAKGASPSGMMAGDIVAALRRAEPAHAVGEAGWGQAYLGIAETLAWLPEHLALVDPDVVQFDQAVSAGAVMRHDVHFADDFDAQRVHGCEEY